MKLSKRVNLQNNKMRRYIVVVFILLTGAFAANAQDANALLQAVKMKIDKVNDYEASGRMKTNVAFLKVPIANVKIYFKKPNRLKVKSEKGISFIPKGAVNLNMSGVISDDKYTVLDAGIDNAGKCSGNIIQVVVSENVAVYIQ